MEQVSPSLPNDIIRIIIQKASLDIDTRLGLRVKPGRLTNDHTYEYVREKLRNIHTRRVDFWKRDKEWQKQSGAQYCGSTLEYFNSPNIIIGPRKSMHVSFTIISLESADDGLRMMIEAVETVEDDPEDRFYHLLPPGGAEAFLRRSTYCIVHSGETCKPIFNDDDLDMY